MIQQVTPLFVGGCVDRISYFGAVDRNARDVGSKALVKEVFGLPLKFVHDPIVDRTARKRQTCWTVAMETEETRALISRYYEALTQGNRTEIQACLSEDVIWQLPVTAGENGTGGSDPKGIVRGRGAVAAELGGRTIKDTFDLSKPFGVEIRQMIVDGDTAAVQQRLTATAKATGASYDNQYCWVYSCAGGEITQMEEYTDTLYASRAMGWNEEG